MLRVVIILVKGACHDDGVRFRGRASWSEVGEVDKLFVEVGVLDEREGNLTSCALGKCSGLGLGQG